MLIGEVAKRAGLSKDTIRHYEALGLLHSHPRAAGSREYRDYDETTLERLSLIAFAKILNFNLKELVEPLDLILSDQVTAEERSARLLEKAKEVQAAIVQLKKAYDLLIKVAAYPEKSFVDTILKDMGLWIE